MPDLITTIVPTTELEAVNAMLSAIGEAPLPDGTDLVAVDHADVQLALNLLRKSTRDVQTEGWRFNAERGVEVAPVALIGWTDSRGTVSSLNVFQLPSGVLRWTQTACSQNLGLDLISRPSKLYKVDGESLPVLYDRAKNRDGCEAAAYPYVYLDLVYGFGFSDMPETARCYATVRAGRQLTQQGIGSPTLSAFSEQDERAALRALVRDQGEDEKLNLFETPEGDAYFGGRPNVNAGPSVTVAPGTVGSLPTDGGLY